MHEFFFYHYKHEWQWLVLSSCILKKQLQSLVWISKKLCACSWNTRIVNQTQWYLKQTESYKRIRNCDQALGMIKESNKISASTELKTC